VSTCFLGAPVTDTRTVRERTPGGFAYALGSANTDRSGWGVPSPEVRERLATGFGATLRAEREAVGLSGRALGRRALVGSGTVSRLERGWRRPRPVTLVGLSVGLDPADPAPVRERLRAAAGDDLVPDTEAGLRRRQRAEMEAWQAGRYPLPARLGHRLAVADHVDRVTAGWLCSLNRVIANPDSDEALSTAEALGAQLRAAQRELDEAGGPARSSYGLGGRPARLRGAGAVLG